MIKRILISLLVILGIAVIAILVLDLGFGWDRPRGPTADVPNGAGAYSSNATARGSQPPQSARH
jgi:hypothetical protein